MHPSQLIALLILIATLTGCDNEPPQPRSEFSAHELFLEVRCDACHGSEGRGSWMGPALEGLDAYWQAGEIAAYLEDPEAVIEVTPRLAAMRHQYPSVMRSFPELSPEERRRIADWLLSRDAEGPTK